MHRTLRAVVVALIASGLGLTLAVVPSNFAPEQAHAAIAPGIPDPVNVLPSVLKGSLGQLPGTRFTMALSSLMNTYAKNPAQWAAITSAKAGVATIKEADLVADLVKKFKLPAFKPKTLVKTVGGVGAALASFDVGLMIGNGIVESAGWGEEGTLCTTGNDFVTGWVTAVNGVDCAGFEEMTAEGKAQANSDVVVGVSGGLACGVGILANRCIKLNSVVLTLYNGQERILYWFTATVDGVEGQFGNSAVRYQDQLGVWKIAEAVAQNLNWVTSTGDARGNGRLDNVWSTGGYLGAHTDRMQQYRVGDDGEAVAPVETDADPERWFECRITGSDGIGYTALSEPFTEGGGSMSPIVCPDLPDGVTADDFSIWEVGGGQSHELVPSTSTTPEYDAAKTAYPECMDGTCMLDLQKAGVSCFQVPAGCTDWFTDPDKTTSMTCRYGANLVALSECNVYAPTFKPDAKQTNQPYGDPTTGEPLPKLASPVGGAVADPTQPRECFPTGWAIFNPVEWILKPVGCALETAFVPRESVLQDQLKAQQTAWADTAPVKVAASVASWVFVPPAAGGCNGITVDVFFLGDPFQIMNACPGSMLASMAEWSRIFGNIAFTVYGVVAITRHVSRIIEFDGLGTGASS